MLKLPHKEPLNLVPFIDIMLVLLCIVLSISTFIAHSKVDINLPNSSIKNELYTVKKIIIVTKDNQYYINDKQVDIPTVESFVDSLTNDDHLELHIDKQAKFDTFIFIVDRLKKNNHENFSIATKLQK